jgi:hypothetical protein
MILDGRTDRHDEASRNFLQLLASFVSENANASGMEGTSFMVAENCIDMF